ncbi:MAG: hypothetical protein Q7J54_07200 [Candidatus Woesearchaeota archaeon]|nr:hypothetical protein [Candidatus Woesearchaeota archaeon]
MLSKTSKILLGVYAFLLLVILLTFSDDFGTFLLLGTGVFTLIMSIFVVKDIKKLKNSLASRILSVVLIGLILYSAIMLFYGLGNIGIGDKGFLFAFTSLIYLVFSGLSIIIGVILVIMSKNQNVRNNPNKILSIILLAVLIPLFYSTAVSGMARLTNNPGFCTMHIEIKENSFIFRERSKDSCILRVALDTSNVAYCNQIKDTYADVLNSQKNSCILNIARDLGDANICYQITNDEEKQGRCIENIAEKLGDLALCEAPGVINKDSCYYGIARESNNGNPELCNYIKDNEARYHCYSIIAIDKRDTSICEKYFPSNEVLIQEGVNPAYYSKEECIKDAAKGAFN